MIKTAQLYENELKQKFLETWYDERYKYYSTDAGNYNEEMTDNSHNHHSFVSIDKENNIIGFIGYEVNWEIKSALQLSIISFDFGNMTFISDVCNVIDDIFNKYNLNRLHFFCIYDNPALESYRTFIKRHGGRECGYERECCMTSDGVIRDIVYFEILKKEYRP